MVAVMPVVRNSISLLLKKVSSWSEAVGLVERGFVRLFKTIVIVLWAARVLGKQLVKLNFMVDTVDIWQAAITVPPAVNWLRVTLVVAGKSEGKVTVIELLAGRGLRICRVMV